MGDLRFWEGARPSEPLWLGPAALSSYAAIEVADLLGGRLVIDHDEARSFERAAGLR